MPLSDRTSDDIGAIQRHHEAYHRAAGEFRQSLDPHNFIGRSNSFEGRDHGTPPGAGAEPGDAPEGQVRKPGGKRNRYFL